MQSGGAQSNDEWPHGMVIQTRTYPIELIELLYIRSAWSLRTSVAVRDLEPVPFAGSSSVPAVAVDELIRRWDGMWLESQRWFWAGEGEDTDRGALLPPRWIQQYGDEGIDVDALRSWTLELKTGAHSAARKEPERAVAGALALAWNAGLAAITVLPYAGHFVEWNGHRFLTVSTSTRLEPELYRQAIQLGLPA